MQSSEQRYRDQAQQDDFFDADLADAHCKVSPQTTHAPSKSQHSNTTPPFAERFM